ncbi:hypothetical protein D5086_007901 [Populus alba]|uniref:Uncharacterized protein n=1 Tax=Populus alba TaxID=43335 RepID=A0ACC4CDT7_POPAL
MISKSINPVLVFFLSVSYSLLFLAPFCHAANNTLTIGQSLKDGNFTMGVDPRGAPQIVIWERSRRRWRSGHWNGLIFSGVPYMTALTTYRYGFKVTRESDGKFYFTYNPSDNSELMRFQITWNGFEEQKRWNESTKTWQVMQSQPSEECRSRLPTYVIILIVLAGLAFLAISIWVLWMLKKRLKVLPAATSACTSSKCELPVYDLSKSKENSTDASGSADRFVEGSQTHYRFRPKALSQSETGTESTVANNHLCKPASNSDRTFQL